MQGRSQTLKRGVSKRNFAIAPQNFGGHAHFRWHTPFIWLTPAFVSKMYKEPTAIKASCMPSKAIYLASINTANIKQKVSESWEVSCGWDCRSSTSWIKLLERASTWVWEIPEQDTSGLGLGPLCLWWILRNLKTLGQSQRASCCWRLIAQPRGCCRKDGQGSLVSIRSPAHFCQQALWGGFRATWKPLLLRPWICDDLVGMNTYLYYNLYKGLLYSQ